MSSISDNVHVQEESKSKLASALTERQSRRRGVGRRRCDQATAPCKLLKPAPRPSLRALVAPDSSENKNTNVAFSAVPAGGNTSYGLARKPRRREVVSDRPLWFRSDPTCVAGRWPSVAGAGRGGLAQTQEVPAKFTYK